MMEQTKKSVMRTFMEKVKKITEYIGKYQELSYSKFRQLISDGLEMALEKHYINTHRDFFTAVGMFGQLRGWPVPLPTSNHALSFALGSIIKKPCVVKNQVEIREFLSITIFYDHDVIDGAPAARFTKRLKTLIEDGFGL